MFTSELTHSLLPNTRRVPRKLTLWFELLSFHLKIFVVVRGSYLLRKYDYSLDYMTFPNEVCCLLRKYLPFENIVCSWGIIYLTRKHDFSFENMTCLKKHNYLLRK